MSRVRILFMKMFYWLYYSYGAKFWIHREIFMAYFVQFRLERHSMLEYMMCTQDALRKFRKNWCYYNVMLSIPGRYIITPCFLIELICIFLNLVANLTFYVFLMVLLMQHQSHQYFIYLRIFRRYSFTKRHFTTIICFWKPQYIMLFPKCIKQICIN
jgi:hypothetical protein